MEQCLMKPDVKKKPKPPKPPPKPTYEVNGNTTEKPTPFVPQRPTDAELSKTQYRTKKTAENEANGNLIQTRGRPAGSPVVPARPTEKELNATTTHSQRARIQETQGSRAIDQSEDTEEPKDESDFFKQGNQGVLSGMFRKSQKEKTPSFTSYIADDGDRQDKSEDAPVKQTPGGKQGVLKGLKEGLLFRPSPKTNREPSPDPHAEDPRSGNDQSSEGTKPDKHEEPKKDKGGLMAGMFRKTPKEKVPSPALTVSTVDSDPDDADEKTSEPSHEKGGFFSGIRKKSPKPTDETPASENLTNHSELSASNDSLSENDNIKEKGGIFSGMFRKSPKTEEDKQPLRSELSASDDSLSDNNIKEKAGVFGGMFKKSPKPTVGSQPDEDKRSLHSELSASNDSLSDNKDKGGLFSGLLRKTPKAQAEENLSAQKELSASNDSLSDNTKVNTKFKTKPF
ncbi:uncharacterized protein ACJ7VT_017490 [Polymixia lowei]